MMFRALFVVILVLSFQLILASDTEETTDSNDPQEAVDYSITAGIPDRITRCRKNQVKIRGRCRNIVA